MAQNRVFKWLTETSSAMKRSINNNTSMKAAGNQAGRWMWGKKK
jgi:hypothetical protein